MSTDQMLPLDGDANRLLQLDQLRAELPALRAIADAARYYHGYEACRENECDCKEYVDETGNVRPGLTGCPNVETRHATAEDRIVRERLEYLVTEVLDLLDRMPFDDDTGPAVRTAVRDEIQRCGMYALEVLDEYDPRGQHERPPLYVRLWQADRAELQAALATLRGQ